MANSPPSILMRRDHAFIRQTLAMSERQWTQVETDFSGIVDYLKENGVTVRQGPVSRWGARGRATSVYFLDPDGNEIELRCY